MRSQMIDAVVVGADRVAANGDTANKIGTYGLSIIAQHHGVPFFVAAPTTTLDPTTPSGDDIQIEMRPGNELTCMKLNGTSHRLVVEGIDVWNPAFDVTPAAMITGVVTDRGVVRKAVAFDIPRFLSSTNGGDAAKRLKTADDHVN